MMRPLLVYYGWPSLINGAAGDLDRAARDLNRWNYLILGDGLDQTDHPDHWNTCRVVGRRAPGTVTFGYVDLGVSTQNLTLADLDWRAGSWLASGVDGIFWDDAGRDFGVTPARLDYALEVARGCGLISCVNTWNPADLAETSAGPEDFYLVEAWWPPFAKRGRELRRLQRQTGVQLLGCTEGPYDRRMHRRCVRGARRHGFLGYGWQQPGYHVDSQAPWRGL